MRLVESCRVANISTVGERPVHPDVGDTDERIDGAIDTDHNLGEEVLRGISISSGEHCDDGAHAATGAGAKNTHNATVDQDLIWIRGLVSLLAVCRDILEGAIGQQHGRHQGRSLENACLYSVAVRAE